MVFLLAVSYAGDAAECGRSFREALGPKPCHLTRTVNPLASVLPADQAFDVPDFRTGSMGLDLPIAFGDPLSIEDDAWRSNHWTNMVPIPPLSHR